MIAHWPEETRGVNTGRPLHALMNSDRHRKNCEHILMQLHSIGFPVAADWRRFLWESTLLAALQQFYRIHDHSLVPLGFVVASGDSEWPIETPHGPAATGTPPAHGPAAA